MSQLEGKVAALATAGVAANPIPIIERVGASAPAIPRDIYRGIDSLWKDVRRFGRTLTPAGIIGLVAGSVLAGLGLSWLRCRNVGSAAKRLCGMNTDALDSLLAGLFVVFGSLSLITFSRDVQGVTEDFAGAVRGFWRADALPVGKNPGLGETGL